jgi:hypothetical protein
LFAYRRCLCPLGAYVIRHPNCTLHIALALIMFSKFKFNHDYDHGHLDRDCLLWDNWNVE